MTTKSKSKSVNNDGKSLKDTLEDIKAKLKPKKSAISADMLDTANTYDDKVAIIRMIVGDEAGRVSSVFRNMMKQNAKSEEES